MSKGLKVVSEVGQWLFLLNSSNTPTVTSCQPEMVKLNVVKRVWWLEEDPKQVYRFGRDLFVGDQQSVEGCLAVYDRNKGSHIRGLVLHVAGLAKEDKDGQLPDLESFVDFIFENRENIDMVNRLLKAMVDQVRCY